ncbi:MAG: hypothetical protein D6762_00415, partial [Candidatus Neomarinimicrobiota bacterium]
MSPRRVLRWTLFAGLCFLLAGCGTDSGNPCVPDRKAGRVITTTELATYTPEQISNLFQAFHLDFSLQPHLKVRVLALDYWTTDPFGADQAVSAA